MSTSTPSGGRSSGWAAVRSEARASRQRVHVEHSVHLQHPIGVVSAALLDAPPKWFPKAVGLHVAGVSLRKKVAVEFGDAARTSSWAVVPVTRSEERRVGKECRCRWWAEQCKREDGMS